MQVWQGQFPPPEAVERYEAVLPGAFNRILAMVEATQSAQIEVVQTTNTYTAHDIGRAHWLGAGTTVFSVIAAVSCVLIGALTGTTGPYYVGGLLVGVPVMAVAKALVETVGRRSDGGKQ